MTQVYTTRYKRLGLTWKLCANSLGNQTIFASKVTFIPQYVWRKFHSVFSVESSSKCDVVFPLWMYGYHRFSI